MPIRKTDKGWFWGSKGPFDTKAKALAVGRAAYAAGYKESAMQVCDFILCLLHSVTNTHILHWQTKSFSEHMALGEFYNEMQDLVDELVEAYQGKYGIIEGFTNNFEVASKPLEYLVSLSDEVKQYRAAFPQDSELQNLVDEIAALIDTTVYKLRFLK